MTTTKRNALPLPIWSPFPIPIIRLFTYVIDFIAIARTKTSPKRPTSSFFPSPFFKAKLHAKYLLIKSHRIDDERDVLCVQLRRMGVWSTIIDYKHTIAIIMMMSFFRSHSTAFICSGAFIHHRHQVHDIWTSYLLCLCLCFTHSLIHSGSADWSEPAWTLAII